MDIEKYKSLAISMPVYKMLRELADKNFEMPMSLARTASYYIIKAPKVFKKEDGNGRSARA